MKKTLFKNFGFMLLVLMSLGLLVGCNKVTTTNNTTTTNNPTTTTETGITKPPTTTESTTAVHLVDLEVKAIDKAYIRGMDITSYIEYRQVNSDSTFGEWTAIVSEDVLQAEIKDGKLNVSLAILVDNKEYKKEVSLTIDDTCLSVSELLKNEPSDTVYTLGGILVGIATTMGRVEYLVQDPLTNAIIGVSGLNGSGNLAHQEMDTNGFKVGDSIIIPVALVKADVDATSSDTNKVYAAYKGGNNVGLTILSSNNTITIDYSKATTIASQDELVSFLTSPAKDSNFYKLVKLHGNLHFIYYESSEHYRFFFDGVSNYAEQKINNVSPCIASGAEYYTTGKPAGDLLFGEGLKASTDWANPTTITKDIYALFIGGNTYYHEFVILSASDVKDVEKKVVKYEFLAPTNTSYKIGSALDLTGAKITLSYEFAPSEDVIVTTEMLEAAPDMTTPGEKTVNVKYQDQTFSFTIKVLDKEATKVELASPLSKTDYNFRDGLDPVKDEIIKLYLSVTYDNGETANVSITDSMISLTSTWGIGEQTIEISYMKKSVVQKINAIAVSTSVSDVKKLPASDIVYDVDGIIIGSAFMGGTAKAPTNGELLIKDKTTNEVIGIKGIITADMITKDHLAGYTLGDEILIRVTIVYANPTDKYSEQAKLALSKSTDEEIVVLSQNNSYSLDKSKATLIKDQADLTAFLLDDDTRAANAYQLIKLSAGAKIVNYGGNTVSSYITYNGTSATSSKIDGLAPYIHEMNQIMTLNDQTYLKLFFGEDAVMCNWDTPNVLAKDVYLMYVGGTGSYYHQFILLGSDYVTDTAAENLKEVQFTAPTKVSYNTGDTLDLAGGKLELIYYYAAQNKEIDLSTIIQSYDMSKEGTQTITFTYDGKNYTYDIMVSSEKASSIEVSTMPTKTTYMPHDTTANFDLTGGVIKATYPSGKTALIDMNIDMLSYTGEVKPYQLGTVTYTLTYDGKTTTFDVTHRALSITEFLALSTGDICEIQGVVVGALTTNAAIELLIKEKDSSKMIGIWNTGVAGTATAPLLDTSIVNVGEEIIVSVKRSAVDSGVQQGKVYADFSAIGEKTFTETRIIVSTGNSVTVTPSTLTVTTISTEDELIAFLNSNAHFYSYVKLVCPKAVSYKGSETNTFYRLFFGDTITNLDEQKVNGSSPVIQTNNCANYLDPAFTTYLSKATGTSYSSPITTEYTIYALFVGGNAFYQQFAVLQNDWLTK